MNKVFISHAHVEKRVGSKLITHLNNVFTGKLEFAFSSEDLSSGQIWQDYLIRKLHECDMCIILISSRYIKSYWCIIEFTAFWLSDKKIFLLSLGDLQPDSLIEPMRKYQMTNLFDIGNNKKFLMI